MSVVNSNSKLAVMEEVSEGTFVAPASGTDFIQPQMDSLEMSPSRDVVERNILNNSVGKNKPRLGGGSVSGSVEMEFKAAGSQGEAPEADKLLKNALGSKFSLASEVTSGENHTTTVINIEDADIEDFEVDMIVLVKAAGAYHVSPISAVDDTEGSANITLLIPMAVAPADNVVIAKTTCYTTANEQTPSLSFSQYLEDALLHQASGCRIGSMSLGNFTPGGLPTLSFAYEGLDYDRTVAAPAFTPSFQNSMAPIVLEAKVFQNGQEIEINELSLSVENTLGFRTSVNSKRGRSSSRITERVVTGSIDPYKPDNNVTNFTSFENGTSFSIFVYAYNPTSTAGQGEQYVAVYLPDCMVTELGEADQDGLMQDTLSFQASRGANGDKKEIVLAFI